MGNYRSFQVQKPMSATTQSPSFAKPMHSLVPSPLSSTTLSTSVGSVPLESVPRQRFDFAHLPLFSPSAKTTTSVGPSASVGIGLPSSLKVGIETLSGVPMHDVYVHYNSPAPEQVQALAYTQGSHIHLRAGQEKHLAHEAWHVVQQKQGRVKPTMQLKGVEINDDDGLEREAEMMGTKASTVQATRVLPFNSTKMAIGVPLSRSGEHQSTFPYQRVIQRVKVTVPREVINTLDNKFRVLFDKDGTIETLNHTKKELVVLMFALEEVLTHPPTGEHYTLSVAPAVAIADALKAKQYNRSTPQVLSKEKTTGEAPSRLSYPTSSFSFPREQGGKKDKQLEEIETASSSDSDYEPSAKEVGHNDGYEDGYFDGLHGKEMRFSFRRTWDETLENNPAYQQQYANGYETGFNEGRRYFREDKTYGSLAERELAMDAQYLTKGAPRADKLNDEEANARKRAARIAFEKFVFEQNPTTEQIISALAAFKEQFGLRAITYGIEDDVMSIGFLASPPDYTHLVAVHHGPDSSKETAHPPAAFTSNKSTLQSEDKDAQLLTPLGAIMSQLSLSINDVDLLVKGDLQKADRPKRVHATIVGPRRAKGGRQGGNIAPATIAHLGHHENILLNDDVNTHVSFYDGGHLIGDQLIPAKSGLDTFEEWNLAPQEQVLNQQSYRLWMENIVAKGGIDASGKPKTGVQISMIASVYYPSQNYTITEEKLAEKKIIPFDATTGKPLSKQNRTLTIPARIPYKWVLDVKVETAGYTFLTKAAAPGKSAKSGNTANPYYNYSDLTTKEIPFKDRHWWFITGSTQTKSNIELPKATQTLHFEAYQYYPKR